MKKYNVPFPFMSSFLVMLTIASYAQETTKIAIVNSQHAFESCAEGKKIMALGQQPDSNVLKRIREEMIKIVNAMAKEKGYDFVFDEAQSGLIYFSPAFDITDELVRRYDAVKSGGSTVKTTSHAEGGPTVPEALGQIPEGKKEPITDLKGLEGFRLPDNSLFITSGFPYDKGSLVIKTIIDVGDSGDIQTLLFYKVMVGEGLTRLANTVPGIIWNFKKANTSFQVGNYVYTALREGSTVEFKKDGVLLRGFKLTPLADFKKGASPEDLLSFVPPYSFRHQ
jgi:hypothetical protein